MIVGTNITDDQEHNSC